jgi:hypothetical protein
MNKFSIATAALIFSATRLADAQATGQAHDGKKPETVFHVVSVASEVAPAPWCETGECTATLLTVKGYTFAQQTGVRSKGVRYVLNCVDVIRLSPPNSPLVCPKLHATREYAVTVFDDSIAFLSPEDDSHNWENYDIISEQEESK